MQTGSTGIKYLYDAAGRLVYKRVNGVAQAVFLWQGDNLLAELDGTATAKRAEYSYYPGLDHLHAVVINNERLYAHADGLGNVIALTDEAQAVRRQYGYDDWGNSGGTSGTLAEPDADLARWKGALWMGPELDLYYMRNRWYEPATGRFLSEDPIGLAGGINPVVFAGGDPISLRDPAGLQEECKGTQESGDVTLTESGVAVLPGIGSECHPKQPKPAPPPEPPPFPDPPCPDCGKPRDPNKGGGTGKPKGGMLDRLVRCTSDQLGIDDLLALGAIAAGQPIPGTKRFVMEGSSRGTSLAGKLADRLLGDSRLPFRLPTIVGGPGTGRALATAWTPRLAPICRTRRSNRRLGHSGLRCWKHRRLYDR